MADFVKFFGVTVFDRRRDRRASAEYRREDFGVQRERREGLGVRRERRDPINIGLCALSVRRKNWRENLPIS